MADFECDVFISYKREERARAEQLSEKLKAIGLRVWFDTRLKSGESFDEQIAGHLKVARSAIVCWTPEAIASTWVRAEASMAHTANKLVPIFLQPTELIPPFNLVQTEDLSDWSGEDDHMGWARLLVRVASLSEDPALQAWATLMTEGNIAQLRAWATAQSAGPLRATTRFWISEVGGGSRTGTATGKANPISRRPRVAWLAISGWTAAVMAAIAVGVLSFQSFSLSRSLETASQEREADAGQLKEAEAKIGRLNAELETAHADFEKGMAPYAGIDRRRQETFQVIKQIEELMLRRPDAVLNQKLEAPAWRETAERSLDEYLNALKAEFRRIDMSGNHLRPASPSAPNIRPAQ